MLGWTFARLHPLTRDERRRALAFASADYLLAIAERPADDQRRWRNYLGPENVAWGEPPRFNTSWYDRNAGIGLFLLAAHELATGERPRLDVHAP